MSPEIQEKLLPKWRSVYFLVYNDGKFLLEERTKAGSKFFGHVIIPGGKVEAGEETSDTVKREVGEEFGIVARKIVKLGSFWDMTLGGYFQEVDAYLVTEFDGVVQNKEPEKAKLLWIGKDQLLDNLKIASSKLVATWAIAELNL